MTRARNSANLASHGNLFVDIANDRTGIGSVVPDQNLHVAGTAGFHADVTFTGDLYNTTWDRSDNSLKFSDNAKAKFGTGGDLQISHNGSNSHINNTTGTLFYLANTHYFTNPALSEIQATFVKDGAVKLYHNGSQKFETTAYGTNTTGTAVNDGLVVAGVATVTTMNVTGVLTYDDVTSVDSVGIVTARQGVRVNVDGSSSSNFISVGASADLKLFHQSGHSRISNSTGILKLTAPSGQSVRIVKPDDSANVAVFHIDAETHLYYNGAHKFSTVSDGILSTGNVTITDGIIHHLDTNTKIRFPANDTVSVETAGSEKFRIDSGGRLFTGGSTQVLDSTAGALHLHGGTSGGRLAFRGTTTSASTGIAEVFAFWDTNKVAGMIAKSGTDTTNKDDGSLHFYTNTGSGISERVSITSAGDTELRNTVSGITNSYSQYLKFRTTQTNGQSAVTGQIAGQGKSNWGGDLVFYSKPANGTPNDTLSERLRITSNGVINCGHGSAVNLHGSTTTGINLNGNGNSGQIVANASSNRALIIGRQSDYGQVIEFFQGTNANEAAITIPAADTFGIETNGTERFRIDSNGDFALNDTATTDAKLDVRTDRDPTTGVVVLAKNNTANGNGTFYMCDINSVGNWSFGMPDNTNAFAIVKGIGNSGTEYVRITSAGRLGIGEDSPDSLLHIKAGNDRSSIRLENTYPSPNNVWELQPGISGVTNTGFCIRDITDGANRFVINGSGDYGFNDSSPTANASGNDTVLSIKGKGSSYSGKIDFKDSSGNIDNHIASDHSIFMFNCDPNSQNSNTAMLFSVHGSERFRFGRHGQLGIAGANYGTSGQVLTSQGSGSAVQWATPAVTGFTNGANNRIVTATSGSGLNGESGLTFDGTNLAMSTSSGRVFITRTSGEAGILLGSGNAGGATLYLDGDSNGDWSGGDYAYVQHNTSGHLALHSTNPSDNGEIQFYVGANVYRGAITSDGVLSMNGAGNSRAIEINAGSNGGSIVIDRNGHITSLIRASDGGSNVGGGSGGGSRITLGKTQIHFKTYPYVSNVGDAVTYTTRASIDTSGNFVPGANNSYDLGSTSLGWRNLYTNDLNLSNINGDTNDVDGTQGSWTIQEGKDDLYIINRLNGKKFRIKMEEII